MSTVRVPLQVSESTKDKIKLASALLGITQTEFVDEAVREFLNRKMDDIVRGFDSAVRELKEDEVLSRV
jgi:hypothetical protein